MTRRVAAAVALACLPLAVLAQTRLNDFARGAGIQAEGGSIFRLQLPENVYETVTRADLGDIRVLDAAGEPVPHSLREAPRPAGADAWHTVRAFPMTDVQDGRPARTQVRVDARGAVLEVTQDPARRATTAYLLDTSGIADPITRIALTWSADPQVTFVARVTLEASDDLNRWRTLSPSAALAQLRRDSFTLTQNEIDVPPAGRPARYLRLSWPKDLAAVSLASVRVRTRASAAEPEVRWRVLTAESIEPDGAALYDARALLPAQYVDLDFVDANDTASVTISSRPSVAAGWIPRQRDLFYTIDAGAPGTARAGQPEGALRNRPSPITLTSDRYWRVAMVGAGGWRPERTPRLRLGWHPHELVFLARGTGPYTLVYGSAVAGPADAPVDALLASLGDADFADRVKVATLGDIRTLGGAEALTQAPSYRRFVLWGVLLAAVAALAIVTLRVLRETS